MSDAYRYISEAYGGYHWDVMNGINFDAGIFMVSSFNFDNWVYQMSYVSANTPSFFDGLRLQIFPSDKAVFRVVLPRRRAMALQTLDLFRIWSKTKTVSICL